MTDLSGHIARKFVCCPSQSVSKPQPTLARLQGAVGTAQAQGHPD